MNTFREKFKYAKVCPKKSQFTHFGHKNIPQNKGSSILTDAKY